MKNQCFKMALTLLLCAASVSAFAQTMVSGKVTNGEGEPILGATVISRGTSTAVITDWDGVYSIGVSGADAKPH